MKHNYANPRPFAEGMGEAVARRTILRKMNEDGSVRTKQEEKAGKPFRWETWQEVSNRVAHGNMCIISKRYKTAKRGKKFCEEVDRLRDHIANGSILTSGRHLQHGDHEQAERNLEVFSNCSTASTSFWKFYLLLNGSGVGRSYDDDLMIVDWSRQPFIHVVLDETHPDYDFTCMESLRQVKHKYGSYNIVVYGVQDSREGWAKALEYLETLIFEKGHDDDVVVFDFSKVRPKGALIGGMQLRPSSGPVPTMNMFNNIKSLKGCKKPLWWQTMYVDHYAAESVLVGGARRSARICVKSWRDPEIIDYINIKKNWTIPAVRDEETNKIIRKSQKVVPLWSANNSVGVDEEFWKEHQTKGTWANKVFTAICEASYKHGTGEPGIINLHKLECKRDKKIFDKDTTLMCSDRYVMSHGHKLCKKLLDIIQTKPWVMIPNPCLCGKTVLLTPYGDKCLYDLKPGDTVWSGYSWTKLTNVWSNGFKEATRYHLDDGSYIDATPDHKVMQNGIKTEIQATNCIDGGCIGLYCRPMRSKYIVGAESLGKIQVFDFTTENKEHTVMINSVLVHNCGEISLFIHGGYCVISDLALYHCETLVECEEAVRLSVRFLMRTNLLHCIYAEETKRTNRIGVSLTGIQEFAWKFFGLTFRDLLREYNDDTNKFWTVIRDLSNAARDESVKYAKELGVEIPHTVTTIKPSGSVSKLFGVTEGAHLPAMRHYFRWVQFRSDDPLIAKYEELGYKTKKLRQYEGTTVVCFPTLPEICKCGAAPVVTAPEATMEEQYLWLSLLEKFWLCGGDTSNAWGNQVSYTLKYSKKEVSYEEFVNTLSKWQPRIRTCSVMPTITDMENAEYEYLPEEPVSLETYNDYVSHLKGIIEEDIDQEHIGCASGACPVDFTKG